MSLLFCFEPSRACAAESVSQLERTLRYELVWRAPPGCPNRREVVRQIEELVAPSEKTDGVSVVKAEGQITQHGSAFVLDLSVLDRGTTRKRQIDSPACQELGTAASLVIAIAIDPTVLERQHKPDNSVQEAALVPPQPSANAPSIVASETAPIATSGSHPIEPPKQAPQQVVSLTVPAVVAPVPTQKEEPKSGVKLWRLGFGALGTYGVLPRPRVAALAIGARHFGHLRVELQATALAASARMQGEPARGASFDLYRLSPRFCWLVADTSWSVGPCAGAELGVISARGFGISDLPRRVAPWFGGTLSALFEVRVNEGAFFGATAELGLPIRRDRFELDGKTLYRPGTSVSAGAHFAAGF
jgi:hypothetical protein